VARVQKTGGVSEVDRDAAAVDFRKAEACGRTRDFSRARGFFEAALRADPRPEYHVSYAAVIIQEPRGDRARAKALLETAMRGDPACVERATVLQAVLARDEGALDQAEKLLRRVLQTNPRSADAERELRLVESRRPQAKPSGGLAGLFRKR
jgi:tetratricopeptide (TPR) repeat protein